MENRIFIVNSWGECMPCCLDGQRRAEVSSVTDLAAGIRWRQDRLASQSRVRPITGPQSKRASVIDKSAERKS